MYWIGAANSIWAVGFSLAPYLFNPFNHTEMSEITFKPIQVDPDFYQEHTVCGELIYQPNGVVVCKVYEDIDGYWKTDAATFGTGFMESHYHRMIADKLDELNAPYEAQLKAYFDSQPKETDQSVEGDFLLF
jgi:hypothetical protein